MDIEKLRKDLLENSDPDGPCIEDDLMQAAATALSTIQEENAEMQKQLNEFSEFLCHMTGGLLSKTNYTAHLMISEAENYQQKVCGECDLQAENEKLRAAVVRLNDLLASYQNVLVPELRSELEQVKRECDEAQSLLEERVGVIGAEPITTAFGLPLDRLRELAQADREGRIMLRSAGSGKKCGSCVHWHRISETKRGTCDVRQWERNRWGHMEPWRHSFTPAQSYGACRYYIPEEDSANG